MNGARPARSMVAQSCPNCGKLHDIGVYVSGQAVQCTCGIRFEAKRSDVKPPEVKPSESDGAFDRTIASSRPTPDVQAQPVSDRATGIFQAPKVPGYELVELLGKGGMGEVWRARQISLGRWVAVKLLPARFASDPEFVARFDKEAQALAALSHPGVVQIIDRGHAGEHYFFVMELVSGITLRDLMNGGPMPLRDALRIGTQLARAIDYAHEKHVVHRDLKPENILVDPRGHVKIADFGLAGMKGHERDIALTATAVAMGTVNYMAPEQRRDAKNVDHRADMYSLGVLIYEMLTGTLPLGRFKMPSHKVEGLGPEVDEILGALLETEPEARPARANLVAEVLESVTPSRHPSQAPASVPPAPPTQVSRPSPSFIQEPGAGWKLGVFVLGGLLVLALVLKFWPHSEQKTPASAPAWYHDSDGEEVFSARTSDDELKLNFEPAPEGGEEINLHAGLWSMEGGKLVATQYGDAREGELLVPRAYVAKRYYSADKLDVAVDVELQPLSSEFPPLDAEAQQPFAELAFRINDVQVSVFAIPGQELRLGWRYFRRDGREEDGNSAIDVDNLQADPVRAPQGRFRLRLKLTSLHNGSVNAEAFVNGTRFIRKELPGLGGRAGKIALGCRNQVCRFDNLSISGQTATRPEATR